MAPLVTRLMWRRGEPGPLMQIVVETMAAEIMTLPIILFTFGTLPALGLVANMIVAPLIPFTMLLTTIAGMVGWIAPALSGWVGAPATTVLEYTVHVVQWLASFHLQYAWQPSWQIMVAMYGAIAIGCIVLWRWLRFDFRSTSVVE
jgi:competence protein ComEC